MEGDTDWERAHWIGGGRHRLAESALDKGGGGEGCGGRHRLGESALDKGGGRDMEGDTDWERAHCVGGRDVEGNTEWERAYCVRLQRSPLRSRRHSRSLPCKSDLVLKTSTD